MFKGKTFTNFGCIWIIDDIYDLTDEQMQKYGLYYRTRIKAHIISSPQGYCGVTEMDCAFTKGGIK